MTAAAQLAGLADLDGHLLIADDPYRGVTVAGGNYPKPRDWAWFPLAKSTL